VGEGYGGSVARSRTMPRRGSPVVDELGRQELRNGPPTRTDWQGTSGNLGQGVGDVSWSIAATADAKLAPGEIFALYSDPSTWGDWGHNTRWARARGPVAEGSTVDVKAGYGKVYPVLIRRVVPDHLIECEVRPPGLLVVNRYIVEGIGDGSRIRHEIGVSGRLASLTRVLGFPRLYTRLLRKEISKLVDLAQA
jgi:hypothetical protein